MKFYIDDVEVTDAKMGANSQYLGTRQHFRWGINIGGSASTATGRQASWTSAKTLLVKVREYATNTEGKIHAVRMWEGAAYTNPGDAGEPFMRPCIGITAIG